MSKKVILDQTKIGQILRRIAYQIFENNIDTSEIVIVGVGSQGLQLGETLAQELSLINDKLNVSAHLLDLDKSDPKETVKLKDSSLDLEGKNVVLVDDVLNTGRTMAYSFAKLLELEPAKVEVAVLVDRGHRSFPISATFRGYELSTTLEEHIEVKLGKKPAVFLY